MQKQILFGLLLTASLQLSAQMRFIEGIITDAATNQPLPFAAVGIQNTFIGTASNAEGRFMLSVPIGYADSTLVVSYMGYKSQHVVLKKVPQKVQIRLIQDIITLNEVEVRPWEAWDYIWNAMQKIPRNYPQKPFMSQGYYSEYARENGVYLKFTEAVVETYNPPYGSDDKTQSKVLKARRGDDLGQLQFMREQIEKKQAKEVKKAIKKGKEPKEEESLDEQILSASFGGPETVLSADPLRDTASFLDIKHKKKYRYYIEGYTKYQGEDVIIIGFESKGVYEHQRQTGNVYISLRSDAIISIELDSEIVIPGVARPVIFLLGFGITNPEIHARLHYKRIGDLWYPSDFSIDGGTRLTKKKTFKKNDRSEFQIEIALVNNNFDPENVSEIPKDERIDGNKALEEQVEPDPEFWENYKVVRQEKMGH